MLVSFDFYFVLAFVFLEEKVYSIFPKCQIRCEAALCLEALPNQQYIEATGTFQSLYHLPVRRKKFSVFVCCSSLLCFLLPLLLEISVGLLSPFCAGVFRP